MAAPARDQPRGHVWEYEEEAFTMNDRNRLMTEVRSDPIFRMRHFEDYYTFMRRMEFTFMRARELHEGARDIWLRRRESRTRFRQEMADRPEFVTPSHHIPRDTFRPPYVPRDREDDPRPVFPNPPRESPIRGFGPSGVREPERSPTPEYTPGMRRDEDVDFSEEERDGFEGTERSGSTDSMPGLEDVVPDSPEVEAGIDERSVDREISPEVQEDFAPPMEEGVHVEYLDDDSDIEMWEPEIPEPEVIYISSDSEIEEDPDEDPEEEYEPIDDFEPVDDVVADPDYAIGSD